MVSLQRDLRSKVKHLRRGLCLDVRHLMTLCIRAVSLLFSFVISSSKSFPLKLMLCLQKIAKLEYPKCCIWILISQLKSLGFFIGIINTAYLELTWKYMPPNFSNPRAMDAKGHGKKYKEIRPPLFTIFCVVIYLKYLLGAREQPVPLTHFWSSSTNIGNKGGHPCLT